MTNALTDEFHRIMRERRMFAAGSPDHEYRTRAARNLVRMMRNIPVVEWAQ